MIREATKEVKEPLELEAARVINPQSREDKSSKAPTGWLDNRGSNEHRVVMGEDQDKPIFMAAQKDNWHDSAVAGEDGIQ